MMETRISTDSTLRVIYDYHNPDRKDELRVVRGDIVNVNKSKGQGPWFYCTNITTQETGYLPMSVLSVIV
jgi:hypothetical protein